MMEVFKKFVCDLALQSIVPGYKFCTKYKNSKKSAEVLQTRSQNSKKFNSQNSITTNPPNTIYTMAMNPLSSYPVQNYKKNYMSNFIGVNIVDEPNNINNYNNFEDRRRNQLPRDIQDIFRE